MTIKEKLDIIKDNVSAAAAKAGRNFSDITVVAVTKTVEIARIEPVLELGFTKIGENYVQELLAKYDLLSEKVDEFHFIGHLQSNKVKYIIDKVKLIHSVDSLSLIKEIDRQAKKIGKIQDILIEVNLAKEESKSGIFKENLSELLEKSAEFSGISIKGLMTIPPLSYDEYALRKTYSELYGISQNIKEKNVGIDMKFLSMGMSGDYQTAISEGANMVRIGTGIFGARV